MLFKDISLLLWFPNKETEEKPITKEQITKIHALIGTNQALKDAIYKKFQITSSKELSEVKARQMIRTLEAGLAKKKGTDSSSK